MATSAPRPCPVPFCRELVRGGGKCPKHKAQVQAEYDEKRGSRQSRGYTEEWVHARKRYLSENPFCVQCLARGVQRPATEVDHIIPHKGDHTLMWDTSNWQGLCHDCHSKKTAREDGRWAPRKW